METSLEALLAEFDDSAPLERASTIPGTWYTDARVADLERKRVFARSWQLVARTAQLETPGQYVTAEVAGEPIVVVRGQDGVLRAFFNVCRHHAAAVMTAPEGKCERLRCPYHGWTYALDGLLQSTPELEGICNFERRDHGLVPMAVAVWEKFVFVHVDEHPPAIEEHLGDMARQIAPLRLDTLHFAGRREWILECNWKVFVDNYLDGGYHVPYLHRGLNSVLSYRDYTIECGDRFCLQSSPIVDPARGAPPATPPGNLAPLDESGDSATSAVRKGQAKYYFLHPNLMLNWYEGYLDTNLVVPLGVDRMKVVFDFYFDDVSEAKRARNEQSMAVSERIQDEDHAICESVQRGLRSRAYGAGRLSVRREAGVNLFHKLLAADLRGASRLAPAK
jgi:choline monooxygenase